MKARFLAVACLFLAQGVMAQDAQTILHLLDYVGVDYAGAVERGAVKSAEEFKEMLEFTATATEQIKALPDNPAKPGLVAQSRSLAKLVRAKADARAVAEASSKLRWAIIGAYKVRIAPRGVPPLAAGKALYARHCAACHGAQGRGDGPAARGLDPAPSDFHDRERMAQRSVYGLYNTISLGVAGTAMTAFRALSEDERWALAFTVANLGVPAERVREGQRLWKAGEAKGAFPDLVNVATLSSDEIASRYGEKAATVQDYLRAEPEALKPAPIAFARQKLAEAREAYQGGDRPAARQAALSAYLEGFELVESPLANVDAGLMREIERRMLDLRASVERAAPVGEVERQIEDLEALLATAETKLVPGELSPMAAFVSSLVILLREGMEAILVLAAILAFVAKTGRRDALRWVHFGWIAALVLGALTWVVAAFAIDVSGANRELTEGVTALLAAAMLLYVGYWLHSKSYADAWTRFIREQVGQALARRTLWAMAAVSFLAVYREMFEVALFYQALWVQAGDGGGSAIVGGIVAAALALAAVGLAIFRYSLRLPLGAFFAGTSGLLALLAVIFTGHGIAALQEAGVIGATRLGFDPVPLLGVYPSGEAIAGQLVSLVLVVFGYCASRAKAKPAIQKS